MRFDEETKRFTLGVREFVSLARRGISESVPTDGDEPSYTREDVRTVRALVPEAQPVRDYLTFDLSDHTFVVAADVFVTSPVSLVAFCPTEYNPTHPPREWVAEMRGEGYIAALAHLRTEGTEGVSLTFLYFNPGTGALHSVEETLSRKKLESFFEKCKGAVAVYARPAIDRVSVRLPSMRSLAFPFPAVRDGQDAFMQAVFRNIKRGTNLAAGAPTGIGKTVSVLYPALRAMGDGKGEKIFYLTPKATAGNAAVDCIRRLCEAGGVIRAVEITAKEKICPRGNICRENKSACPALRVNKLADAALALYDLALPVVTRAEIEEVAATYNVCPYELSLSYAEIADVVICDVNYLFDSRVRLRRFFEAGGDYVFLIDEAHNLPDRVSAMYSDEISEYDFDALLPFLGEKNPLLLASMQAKGDFRKLLFTYLKENIRKDNDGREIGFTNGRDLPDALYSLFHTLTDAAGDALFSSFADKSEGAEARSRAIRAFYYRLSSFTSLVDRFDRRFEYFMRDEDGVLSLKLVCLDPSGIIPERVGVGRCAVYFSATLSPATYYRSLFGMGREDELLAVDSPFDPERLSVTVMDKISTRTSERERTLPAVVRVIEATIAARRGHYMIFSPSFAYNEALAAAFKKKRPNAPMLVQTRGMSEDEKRAFIEKMSKEDGAYLLAFCVMGGSYAEGIDLTGDKLIGAVVVGIGMPGLSSEREAMTAYFEEKYEEGRAYAYVYPGFNKVLQAAGRVIRTEEDRGVIVLVDDRFADPLYQKSIPSLWRGMKSFSDPHALFEELKRFWSEA